MKPWNRLIEAMAAGCAGVASEAGPIPEIVEHDFATEYRAAGGPRRVGICRLPLLSDADYRKRIGDAARITARERFQPKKAAEQLTQIYGGHSF